MSPEQWMDSALKSWRIRFNMMRYKNPRVELLRWCSIEGECWVSSRDKIRIDGKEKGVQRAAYVLFEGPLDKGDVIIPLCRNRRCCWSGHLHRVPREMIAKARKERELREKLCASSPEPTPDAQ